jgi:hypothetical protein
MGRAGLLWYGVQYIYNHSKAAANYANASNKAITPYHMFSPDTITRRASFTHMRALNILSHSELIVDQIIRFNFSTESGCSHYLPAQSFKCAHRDRINMLIEIGFTYVLWVSAFYCVILKKKSYHIEKKSDNILFNKERKKKKYMKPFLRTAPTIDF